MIRRVSTPTPDHHGSPTLPGDGSEVGTITPSGCGVDLKLYWVQPESGSPAARLLLGDPKPGPARRGPPSAAADQALVELLGWRRGDGADVEDPELPWVAFSVQLCVGCCSAC